MLHILHKAAEALHSLYSAVTVSEGASVQSGDVIGTVSAGRSMFLKVYVNGAPQDPTQFVDLGLQN